nr:MAG TPA: hypothetical protein [Caudoviricetes sp.]
MTKKQGISIGIIAAILTGVFMYAVYYFPYVLAECMFWVVCFFLLWGLLSDCCTHLDKG